MAAFDADDRAALRGRLRVAAPWLDQTAMGPRAVDAGNCDRCARQPRLLPTCGPAGWAALCRDCAQAIGDEGWCDGHLDDGHDARRWAASLPDRWADVVVAWWVATGELRLDPDAAAVRIRAALGAGDAG